MFRRGFKLGMILQLLVGPISLLVFQTAGTGGLPMALVVVLAVAIVDAAFLAIAGAGAVHFLKKEKVQRIFKFISCMVLVLFGINTILGAFDINVLPEIRMFSQISTGNYFLKGLLLSLSNPMSILFWNSIMTAEASRQKMTGHYVIRFGAGCVFSTVVFLSALAVAGSLVNRLLPEIVMSVLDVLIGLAMIVYGIILLAKKKARELADCPK